MLLIRLYWDPNLNGLLPMFNFSVDFLTIHNSIIEVSYQDIRCNCNISFAVYSTLAHSTRSIYTIYNNLNLVSCILFCWQAVVIIRSIHRVGTVLPIGWSSIMHHMWSRPSHELVLVPDFLPQDRVIISFYIFHRARSNYAGWFDSTHTSHAHWDAVADWTIIEIDRVQGSAIHDYTGMYHVSLPLHLIQLSHREGAQSSSEPRGPCITGRE